MRQFVALELPGTTRGRLAELSTALRRSTPGWRWLRPEALHLTLRFLGEVRDEQDAQARDGWRRAAANSAPFTLHAEGLGVFPPRGSPRILWVGLREIEPGDRLAALARGLESAAREVGFSPEERVFRPHLTIARAERDARPAVPSDLRWTDPEPFESREIVLFRSDLHPSGARYTALERYPLGG